MRKTNTNSSKRINEQLTLSNQKPRTRGALFLINSDSKKKLDILYLRLAPKLDNYKVTHLFFMHMIGDK